MNAYEFEKFLMENMTEIRRRVWRSTGRRKALTDDAIQQAAIEYIERLDTLKALTVDDFVGRAKNLTRDVRRAEGEENPRTRKVPLLYVSNERLLQLAEGPDRLRAAEEQQELERDGNGGYWPSIPD